MMSSLNKTIGDCEQIRTELALFAGDDLDSAVDVVRVRGHLAGCAECRTTLAQLTESLAVLETCAVTASSLPKANLWPAISRRLPIRTPSTARARFNLWVPTAAMTAACAAMILVTIVQFERVAPFQPTVTPHIRTAIEGTRPVNLFHAPEFVGLRDPRFQGAPSAEAVPVGLPAAHSWPRLPDSDLRDREW